MSHILPKTKRQARYTQAEPMKNEYANIQDFVNQWYVGETCKL